MKNRSLFLLIPLALMVIVACSTVEDDEPNTAIDGNGQRVSTVDDGTVAATDSMNFRTLLTDTASKTWKTSLFTLAGSTDFTSCRLDDIMQFLEDGTYSYQGGQLCGAEDNQANRMGTWEIQYKDRKIVFDKGTNNQYEAEVIGLTENELRVKGSYMGMEVRGLYILN